MALSKIVENSIADEAVSSAKLKDFSAAVDLNGVELILDADQDTSITADTDDRIDFKIAGVEHFSFSNSSGDTIIKPMVDAKDIKFQQFDGRTLLDINDGGFVGVANGATGPGEIRIFEDTDNGANYVGLSAGSISSSITFILPTADGSAGQFLKTDGSLGLSFDTVSSAADDLTAGDAAVNLTTTSGNITIDAQGDDTDIIFKGTDGGADTTFLTIDGSAAGAASFNGAITANAGVVIDNITIDGTEIDLSSGDLTVDVAGDIILDADGGDVQFKDGGTHIGSISNSSSDLLFSAEQSDQDMIFKVNDGGSSTEVFRLDGDVSAILVASGKELRFADSGEKISGNGTDLTINSGADINLTATADVNIPSGVGVTFGDDGEKIEGDGTDLTIASSAKINLTATSDIHIPNNVGIIFGGDSEKIEGDGTDMTISANNLTVDAAADITLDAAGNDLNFAAGGTTVLNIQNSSSDVIIKPVVDAKDLIFQQRDGTEVMRIEDGAHVAFTAAALNPEATLTDASTISWNVLTSPVAKVTLGANRTLGAGTGGVAGSFQSLLVIQDGTGSRTLNFNAAYEFKDDTAPTLTTTANKGDLFVFRYNGSKFLEVGRNLNLTLS